MNSFKRACESLVIAAETSESREPAEASFDDPSARKKDKAFSGLLEFDHFKLDAVLFCVPGGLFSGIALINPGELNVFSSGLLGRLSKLFDLMTVLLIGWGNTKGQ